MIKLKAMKESRFAGGRRCYQAQLFTSGLASTYREGVTDEKVTAKLVDLC
jgi:hypothetical protein